MLIQTLHLGSAMATSSFTPCVALRNLSRGSRHICRLASSSQFNAVADRTERSNFEHREPLRLRRHLHNSRQLRAPNDSSTIDFAYLPETRDPDEPEIYRVPILPNNYSSTTNAAPEDDTEVMKAEISTMSADAIFLPMADMSDGHAMNIDFHAMADRVAVNLRQIQRKLPVEEQASMMKQLWADLVDDMVGSRKKGSSQSKE